MSLRVNLKRVFGAFETNCKRPRLNARPMANPHFWPTARLIYRGYALEVRPASVGWRVAVYPKGADLPILQYNEIFSSDQHRALADAKKRIDGALTF